MKAKLLIYNFCIIFFISFVISGCEAIGDILQGAIWLIVIIVVLVIALISWVFRKIRGR